MEHFVHLERDNQRDGRILRRYKAATFIAGRPGSKAKHDESMTSATLEAMAGETHRRTSTHGLLRNT